jgi:hypothetical protein
MATMHAFVDAVFAWLPDATVALRFGTAAIGFGFAVAMLVRDRRRRRD